MRGKVIQEFIIKSSIFYSTTSNIKNSTCVNTNTVATSILIKKHIDLRLHYSTVSSALFTILSAPPSESGANINFIIKIMLMRCVNTNRTLKSQELRISRRETECRLVNLQVLGNGLA